MDEKELQENQEAENENNESNEPKDSTENAASEGQQEFSYIPTWEKNLITNSVEKEITQSYIDYAMSVIISRALPDTRDWFKPVLRRILFWMAWMNNFFREKHKKSARIVWEVMWKYHPHGDSSIYEAMVRLAQPWSMRYPLVDGQGNFGSIDWDGAAAMRYTEARLTKIAEDKGGEGKTVLQAKAMNACDFPRKQTWLAPSCPLEWTKLLLCHLRYMWGPKRKWPLLFPISLHDSVKCVSIREINDLPVVIAPQRLFFPSFQNPFF